MKFDGHRSRNYGVWTRERCRLLWPTRASKEAERAGRSDMQLSSRSKSTVRERALGLCEGCGLKAYGNLGPGTFVAVGRDAWKYGGQEARQFRNWHGLISRLD